MKTELHPVCHTLALSLGFNAERSNAAAIIQEALEEAQLIPRRMELPPIELPKAPPVSNRLTTDPTDPDLTRGVDRQPGEQAKKYLVLPESERQKGFVRPYRDAYRHRTCGTETIMGRALSETYARDPKFYGSTWCMNCRMHLPVSEFNWLDGDVVGS